MAPVTLAARVILAAVFVVSAWAKLADREGSRTAARDFGAPQRLAGVVALALPLAELGAAAMILVPATARTGAIVVLVLLAVFSVAVARLMARGEAPDCHCFGALAPEPAGPRTLVRNGVLAALALVPLLASRPGASPWGWVAALDTTQAWLLGAVVALTLALAALGAIVVQMLRQNGRILERLEALEASGAGEAQWDDAGYGLPVGDRAPAFALPSLDGEAVTLDDLRAPGLPVVLVFTDPDCEPCGALLPELGRWENEHADALTLVLVSRGTAEANRAKAAEHGVTRVLRQADREVAIAFNCPDTPTALVVDPDGIVALPAAPGAEAIRALVARATGAGAPTPFQVIPPAPAELPVGAPAPALTLTDLDGHAVDFTKPRADGMLLMFWDPGCGFCRSIAGELVAREDRAMGAGPELILIAAGTEADNRALAPRARIALDPGFTAGTAFGASGTPSAVMVDGAGRIGTPLSAGAPAVLALAGSARVRPADWPIRSR